MWRKNFVTDTNEVCNIFVLFCEDIGKICLAVNMFDGDRAIGDRLMNSIFENLQVTYVFEDFFATPVDCNHVIVEYCGRLMEEICFQVKIVDDVGYELNRLNTLISGVDFSLSR